MRCTKRLTCSTSCATAGRSVRQSWSTARRCTCNDSCRVSGSSSPLQSRSPDRPLMRLVTPSVAEAALWREALAFLPLVPDVGFAIAPRDVTVHWFVDEWGEHLHTGWVPMEARPPVPIHLKAGRLRSEPEMALRK